MQETIADNFEKNTLDVRRTSHAVFAVVLIGWGILGFIKGDFASGWLPVPESLPGRQVLAYVCSFMCIATGVGLFLGPVTTLAARVLFLWLLAWLVLLRLPWVVVDFGIGTWWSASATAILLGSVWILYSSLANEWDRQHLSFLIGDKARRIAKILFGLGFIPIGVAHFLYMDATAPLVPAWMQWPEFWGYFTGVTFIAAGVAVVFGVLARLAAVLVTLQIILMTLLVWVPLSITGHLTPFQWGEFAFSIVLSAFAWVFADSYSNTPIAET